jgi:hypothetical protein
MDQEYSRMNSIPFCCLRVRNIPGLRYRHTQCDLDLTEIIELFPPQHIRPQDFREEWLSHMLGPNLWK